VVVLEAAAAVEVDGGIAVGDFEVEVVSGVLAGGGFGQVEELSANSLSAMSGQDEEFIDPGTFAAIFETEIEADNEVGDGSVCVERQVDDAVDGIGQEFVEIVADGCSVEGFGPGIFDLHLAHEKENGIKIGGGGRTSGDGHSPIVPLFSIGEEEPATILIVAGALVGGAGC
jgi:hypothetical protein